MKKLILIAFALPFLFVSKDVLAYDTDTHAYLTDEAIKFYNNNFPKNYFSPELVNYVLDGARREDDIPRWMNHFYDPVHNSGLSDALIGAWEKSKDWADDSDNQNGAKYKVPTFIGSILSAVEKGRLSEISSETDFTWSRAIEYYAVGEKEKAFFMLGHVMHLVEDAGVPDHTRNDPHPGDSPYENWTAQFNLNNKDLGLPARLVGKAFIRADNLSSYFDGLAKYSNNNFYSKDTIGLQSGYGTPELNNFSNCGDYLCYTKSDDLGEYKISIKKRGILSNIYADKNEIVIFYEKPGGDVVLKDYWSHLSTKTVQHAAGVIDLFFKEAEAAKNNPALIKRTDSKSLFASITAGAKSIVSYVDNAVQETFNAFQSALENNVQQVQDPSRVVTQEIISPQESAPEPETEETKPQSTPPDETSPIQSRIDDLTAQAADLESKILAKKSKKSQTQIQTQIKEVQVQSQPQVQTQIQTIIQPAPATSTQTSAPTAAAQTPAPVYYYYYYTQTNNNNSNSSTSANTTNNNSTSTATSTSSVTLEIARNSSFSNTIFISEYLFHGTGVGGDTGREFVELYNSGNQPLDLSGWSLKYARSDATSTESLALFSASDHGDKTTIPAKGFLLIGLNNYDGVNYGGTNADILRSASLPNVSGSSEGVAVAILLFDGDGKNVDGAAYTANSISKAGDSLERKAKTDGGSCISALSGVGEFIGNSCGTGAGGDFEVRSIPKPQNSSSFPEPRNPPSVSNASLIFSSSTMNLVFKWDEVRDFAGDALSVSYEIRNASTSEIFATTTGAIGLSRKIDEVGRSYDFILKAFDREGFGSAPVSMSVYAPSFFNNLYFYRDVRASSSMRNVLDAYFNQYPFIPGSRDKWKLALFYVNSEPQRDLDLLENNQFLPVDSSALATMTYPRCSGSGTNSGQQIIFPDSVDRCSNLGGGLVPQGMVWLEDHHFIVPISAPNGVTEFGTSAYVTAAFYDYYQTIGGYADFRLVATDKQKYHFQTSPPVSSPPAAPGDLTIQFDGLRSMISLSWLRAIDSDTLDDSLTYEINYSSSTQFSADGWKNKGRVLSAELPVIFGNSYRIGVRAVDDFGNISALTDKNWNFPSDYSPFPYQRDASQIIGMSDGAGQRVLVTIGSNMSKVGMIMGKAGGIYSVTDTFVGIYSDNNGSRGNLLATSADINHQWPIEDHPSARSFEFNFPTPIYLSASTYYWLVPMNGPGASNLNYIFGSATDTYPDGYWSGDAGKDASFYISR